MPCGQSDVTFRSSQNLYKTNKTEMIDNVIKQRL